MEPCLPRTEPLPSRQQGSQCSTRSRELVPCWESWPDLKFISLSSPVTQTVAQRLSHSSCGCPRMLMFESKQSKVPAENQLQGTRDGCPATLSPWPSLEGGFWAVVTHPLASGSSTVGTPRLMDILLKFQFHDVFPMVVVQSLSRVQLLATPWTIAHQAFQSCSISHSLLKLTSIESMMPSNHLILCHPLLLLPSVFPSIRVFSSESALC